MYLYTIIVFNSCLQWTFSEYIYELYTFERETLYGNEGIPLEEIKAVNSNISLSFCALTCASHQKCKAFEICSVNSENICRLLRCRSSLRKDIQTGGTCRRFQKKNQVQEDEVNGFDIDDVFYGGAQQKNKTDAVLVCESRGQKLFEIGDSSDFNKATEVMKQTYNDIVRDRQECLMLISGEFNQTTGTFYFLNGSTEAYGSLWCDNQPELLHPDLCLCFAYKENSWCQKDSGIDDCQCRFKYPFMCECP